MKKLFNLSLFASIIFSFLIFGCANSIEENHSANASKEYGYVMLGAEDSVPLENVALNKSSRAIDYSTLGEATIKVYYFEDSKIASTQAVTAPISETGSGTFTLSEIPTGNNRVIEIKSGVSGAVLYYLMDKVTVGNNGSVSVTWDSTPIGAVYYNLMLNGTDVSSYGTTEKSSYEAKIKALGVHASLVDAQAIAKGTEGSTYILDYGTVKISATGCSGYSYQITDIATQKQSISSSSYSEELKATPGVWKLWVYDSTGAKVETKTLAVAEGAVTNVTLNYEEAVTGKIVVHVPTSLGYSYIWAWATSGTENYTGGTWPGKSMTKNGNYYDYTIEQTASKVIFNNNGGSTVGTNQTNDLYLKEGEWEYIGGKSGTKDTTGSSISSNFKAMSGAGLTVSVENPAVPLPPTVSINYKEGEDVSLSGSIIFTVTSENTDLTSGTYTIGTKTGTLSVGTTTVKLSAAGITDEGEFAVSASVTNAKGTDSLSVKLNAADLTSSIPDRLGAYYTKKATSFSIWSPDSSNVTVEVTPVGGTTTSYTCEKGFTVNGDYPDSKNIYGVTVSGDLALAEYQFKISGVAVRDPYGKMIKYDGNQQKTNKLADGTEHGYSYTSYAGPSVNIVMDMSQTDPTDGWADRPVLENRCDAIVYEVHISDFTSDSTWGGTSTNAGKFPGMTETGTTYTSGSTTVKTGIDHLKELGITHVQLLPMYDFATKYNNTLNDIYNWGYDPVNYNVPEDRYSTCPGDYVERIREVKNMINEFHKNGIRVIMDVVYNHTFGKEIFSSISSSYYTSGDLSGCGNSTNTGISMVSRMIRDSLEYWAEEYNLDGFRFDLIGIYHTSAVKEWGEYLNNTNSETKDRNLLMYGEPWNGYATDSEESSKVRMGAVSGLSNAHVGVFNGKFRQSLKGANDAAARGYIFNANEDDKTAYAKNIAVGLKGSGTSLDKTGCSDTSGTWTRFFTVTPDQSINYMFAHDNLCYWDKIKVAFSANSMSVTTNSDYAKRIVKFGHGILFVSQGIPFMHAGDEMLRTKEKGAGSSMSHNSYMAGTATNSIDWSLKVTNKAVFDYHADLIKLRKDHDGLRYRNGVGTTETSGNAVKYYVQDTDGTKLCIVVNPADNIANPVSGTKIFDINGLTPTSTQCEGTAVTVIKY